MARPHIQVVLADDAVPPSLQAALKRTDATASFWPLPEAVRNAPAVQADALVVVVGQDVSQVCGPLRILFDRLADHPRAALVLTSNRQTLPAVEHPPTVPVSYGANLDEHDLSIRLAMMLEMRDSLDSLHRGLLANRRSGDSVAKRYMKQIRLASRVQRGFLPETLPSFGRASFDLVFRPVDYVSGDIYDVHRLDENHVGIAVADASGHGIPAALLTVYIKRALRGKEIENGSYRILSPDEVLLRLNEDIVDAQLAECPFVAAIYAVLNTETLELTLARGGAPFPICRRANGELEFLAPAGGVVGVLPDAQFATSTISLEPGDSVLLYSDGLERIVAPQSSSPDVPAALEEAAHRITDWRPGTASDDRDTDEFVATFNTDDGDAAVAVLPNGECDMVGPGDGPAFATERSMPTATGLATVATLPPTCASAEDLLTQNAVAGSPWCATLQQQGIAAALEQVAGRQRALRRLGYPLDDLTVLSLQIKP